MRRDYCTYFDFKFLPRGLALYRSLKRWAGDFRLHVLCLDPQTHDALRSLNLPDLRLIELQDLEAWDVELPRAKATRSATEYFFTLSPALPLFIFERHADVEQVTYLDADLYFYSDPDALFKEIGGASVAIVPHRFSQRVADRAKFGHFNVGWISFRRDENGLRCLRWWRDRCIEWCYARLDGDRYADQKYLDRWPELFGGVHVVGHPGANLGPWNLERHAVTGDDTRILVDGQPLIFFHFSSFLPVAGWLYNTNFAYWKVRPNGVVRRCVIGAYTRELRGLQVGVCGRLSPQPSAASPAIAGQTAPGRIAWAARKLRAIGRILGGLLLQDHVVILGNRVL